MRSTWEGLICPNRVIDDIGSGYSLGLILGSIWNFTKGAFTSHPKEWFLGGISLLKRKAPIQGGNFAGWMGLFGFWQCSLLYITGTDNHLN